MNRADRVNAALEEFDRHMVEATGHTFDEYEYIRAAGPRDPRHVELFGRLVDESGVAEFLEACDRKDRKSAAGRKPQLSFRAVLILIVMHVDAGDARHGNIGRTLFARLSPESRVYLGLPEVLNDENQWYMRFCRSLDRMLELVEPWDVSKKRIMTAAEFVAAKETYSQEKRDRAEEAVNMLLHTTVRRLPADIMSRYKGNVAIDATPLKLVGPPNARWTDDTKNRRNLDGMSTPYTRVGNHEGDGRRTDEAAWELETVVTVANKPGDNLSFPVLMSGASMQHPGRNKYGPLRAVKQHAKVFDRDHRYFMMGDQMYNWFNPERFQNEIRKLGFRGVWNFGSKDEKRSGIHGTVEDAVAADGYLYVKWTPKDVLTATTDYESGTIDYETFMRRIDSRRGYALTPHGRADEDGFQRWTYPPLKGLMLIDPATEEPLKRTPTLAKGSLTLGPDSAESMRIIKHIAAVPYYSPAWHGWFGLRNRVEENNDWFKSDEATDIGNPKKRRARGYAYNFVFAGAAAAVSNMRRIVAHLEAEALEVVDRSTLRARRRLDIHGNRLEHLETAA